MFYFKKLFSRVPHFSQIAQLLVRDFWSAMAICGKGRDEFQIGLSVKIKYIIIHSYFRNIRKSA